MGDPVAQWMAGTPGSWGMKEVEEAGRDQDSGMESCTRVRMGICRRITPWPRLCMSRIDHQWLEIHR